ncbi:hypothetical protein CBR_g17104 [Chara braunii]|uniref:Uncharacterized protein n=1 Tax=Chara braunii TaxID=69332 RepID=A0A388KUM5_CHABU|nr:hypothetical protein CBR_g17104 [Chara braunii]|eukprot:GBG73764.1 hypothetical protein CBR_g17104 [Chara braunii]
MPEDISAVVAWKGASEGEIDGRRAVEISSAGTLYRRFPVCHLPPPVFVMPAVEATPQAEGVNETAAHRTSDGKHAGAHRTGGKSGRKRTCDGVTAVPRHRYDPLLYNHLQSWKTPLPPSDEDRETEKLATLPLGSRSTQMLSQTVQARGSASNKGGQFTSLLQQGLGDDDGGQVDLRFGLSSDSAREATCTFIIDTDPLPCGLERPGSQRTEQSTLRAGAFVSAGVGASPSGRQHGLTASSNEHITNSCPARIGVAAGSLHIGDGRSPMSNPTRPTQPDLRDDPACRPPVRPRPTVENTTRGVSNMRAQSDGGDDDADEGFREDVEAGDDDDDIHIRPLGKTVGRGKGRNRGVVRGRSVGRGRRGGVNDGGGKSATHWSTDDQLLLGRCKLEQDMHLVGLGHNYGRM